MAAHRSSESPSPPRTKPYHGRSRRSPSSSSSASPRRPPSHSSSPRSKRLKRAKQVHASSGGDESDRRRPKDYDKREHGRSRERYRDEGREKYYDAERERGKKDRDKVGIKNGERSIEKDRSEKYREKDGREKPRDRKQERSSPKRSHLSRSLSPRPNYHKGSHSSPKRTSASSPSRRRRSSPEDKLRALAASAASRAEVVSDKGDRSRADGEEDSLAKMMAAEAALEAKQKEKNKPSFEYSGKLAAETNRVRGVTLLFTEPPEARKPTIRWRLYVFKEGEPFNEPLYIHRQSCYLFGRERRVADIPTDHISCSKQHAVIQYRLTEKEEADDATSNKVRPYVMDLGSTNGTFLNAASTYSYMRILPLEVQFYSSQEYLNERAMSINRNVRCFQVDLLSTNDGEKL